MHTISKPGQLKTSFLQELELISSWLWDQGSLAKTIKRAVYIAIGRLLLPFTFYFKREYCLQGIMDLDPSTILRVAPGLRARLVILNRPLANVAALATIWQNTVYRICADGGANRLYDLLSSDMSSKIVRFVSVGDSIVRSQFRV
jgi:hypothetical protein